MSKIKNGGLDQYGTEPFEQQQYGASGVEGVKTRLTLPWRTLATSSSPTAVTSLAGRCLLAVVAVAFIRPQQSVRCPSYLLDSVPLRSRRGNRRDADVLYPIL